MKDPCYYCEADQLKQIVRDATKACQENWSASEILVILERPIKPSIIENESEDE